MSLDASILLDGADDAGDARSALERVAADAEARDRYTLFGLIGDVLRGNSTPDDGFSRRIFERIARERVRIEPGFDPLSDE